jgi:hypothetical protein
MLKRVLQTLLGALGLILFCYGLAALIGSLWTANSDWKPPREGVAIYLHNNGIHTSLILPSADMGPSVSGEAGFPGDPAIIPGWQLAGAIANFSSTRPIGRM